MLRFTAKMSVYLIICICNVAALAQTPVAKWFRVYDSPGTEYASDLLQTSDGGMLLAGSADQTSSASNRFYIIKVDSVGDSLWSRSFSFSDTTYEMCRAAIQMNDDGYLIVGQAYGSLVRGWVVRTNSYGDSIWSRIYGEGEQTYFYDAVNTIEMGVLLAGEVRYSDGHQAAYLVRIDQNGDTLWVRQYGMEGYADARSVIQTSDSGFVFCGRYGYEPKAWLVKINASGDLVWTHVFQSGCTWAGRVVETMDNNLLFGESYRMYRISQFGDSLWSKTWSNLSAQKDVAFLEDGGILRSGENEVVGTDALGNQLWMLPLTGSYDRILSRPDGSMVLLGGGYSRLVVPNSINLVNFKIDETVDCGSFSSDYEITNNFDQVRDIAAADFDFDGDMDVIAVGASGIAWWTNDGTGHFSTLQGVSTEVANAYKITLGDLNNDSYTDLIIGRGYPSYDVQWWRNNGNSTFTPMTVISSTSEWDLPSSINVADLDNDHDFDVVVVRTDQGMSWYPNLGSGSFGTGATISTLYNIRDIVLSDFNGDSLVDIAAIRPNGSNSNASDVAWWSNTGGGAFSGPFTFTSVGGAPGSITCADLDGDSDVDILCGTSNIYLYWWRNEDAHGTFILQENTAGSSGSQENLTCADIDRDGDLDVVSASYGADAVNWFENAGQGRFVAKHQIGIGCVDANPVHAVDLSRDGNPDVLVGINSQDRILWWKNNCEEVAGSLTLGSPNTAGEVLYIDSLYSITWTSNGITGNVSLYLNRNYPTGIWETIPEFQNISNSGSAQWLITGFNSANCRIKITSVDDPGIADVSDFNFAVSGTITITGPADGEVWRVGERREITWTTENMSYWDTRIQIDVRREDITPYWTRVATNLQDRGSYTWTVPYPTSENVWFRVKWVNAEVSDTTDTAITITTPPQDTLWSKTYGENSTSETAEDMQLTLDGGYILCGGSYSSTTSWNFYFVKTNSDGDTAWTRVIDLGSGERAYAVLQTDDGGFIACGGNENYSYSTFRWISAAKIDSTGNLEWSKVYSIDGLSSSAYDIEKASDGGYVIAGGCYSSALGDRLLLMRINDSGDTLWTKTYDEDPASTYGGPARAIKQTSDGGYFVGGGAYSFVARIDFAGDTVWTWNTRQYDYSGFSDLDVTSDGGCVLALARGSNYYPCTVKLTSEGQLAWSRIYSRSSDYVYLYSVRQVPDGGFVFAGSRYPYYWNSNNDIYVIRTGLVGDTIWTKTFSSGFEENGQSIVLTPDGGYAVAAKRIANSKYDALLLKLPPDGNGHYRLRIVSPNENDEIRLIGDTTTILWASQYNVGNVAIELNRAYSGGTWETITLSTPNDGSYSWVINGPETYYARIRITNLDDPEDADTSDTYFQIAHPYISVQTLWGDEEWSIGEDEGIHIESSLREPIRVELNRNYPSGTWDSLITQPYTEYSYVIATPPPTDHARLRAFGMKHPWICDTSDVDFSIHYPSLTLLSPNGGEVFTVGYPYQIRYLPKAFSREMIIQINRDYPAGVWELIDTVYTSQEDSISWTTTGPACNRARIRIIAAEDTTIHDVSDGNFAISNSEVLVLAPNGTEVWEINSHQSISWIDQRSNDSVNIEINRSYPGPFWETLFNNYPADSSCTWLVTYPSSEHVRIRVSAANAEGISDTSDGDFIIPPPPQDSLPGVPSDPVPADSAININDNTLLSWYPDAKADMYDVYVWRRGQPMPSVPSYPNVSDITITPTTALEWGKTYYWRVVSKNVYGEFSGPTWIFTIRSLPDIRVTSIQVPPEIWSGTQAQISWTVTNIGTGSTAVPRWNDYVWLSPDLSLSDHDFLDIKLATCPNVSYLNPGESYVQTQMVVIPQRSFGPYYLFVSADNTDAWEINFQTMHARSSNYGPLVESDENNNFLYLSIEILPSPTADFQIVSVAPPSAPISGTIAYLTGILLNNSAYVPWGTQFTDPFYSWPILRVDDWYLSHDSIFDANDTRIAGYFADGYIYPHVTDTFGMAGMIPDTFFGPCYYIVRTDARDQVYEGVGENNNIWISERDTVLLRAWPNLVVTSLDVPPIASSGYPFIVTWQVRNNGAGEPYHLGWEDYIYLSSDTILNPDYDILLSKSGYNSILPPDSTYLNSSQIIMPNGTSGSFYILVDANGNHRLFEHTDTQDNVEHSDSPISVRLSPWADLNIDTVVVPAEATAGTTLIVDYIVHNAGDTATIGMWTDRVYLSSSAVWYPHESAPLWTRLCPQLLSPDSAYGRQISVTIPDTAGGQSYIYLVADADSSVFENGDESNNIRRSSIIMITPSPAADLSSQEQDITIDGSGFQSGHPYYVTWKIKNIGQGRTLSSHWIDGVYLSSDSLFSPQTDYCIRTIHRYQRLEPGNSYNYHSLVVSFPQGMSGEFYLFGCTDIEHSVNDEDTSNNVVFSHNPVQITLSPVVDLQITELSVSSVDTAGQPMTVRWTVPAEGNSFDWYDAVFLSTNAVLDSGDLQLGWFRPRGSLDPNHPNGYYEGFLRVIPPLYAVGYFYVIVKTDVTNIVYEHEGEDNNTRSQIVEMILPPPSDLRVTDVHVPAMAAPGGEGTVVSYVLQNDGLYAARGWITDGVYFSADTIWDIDDAPMNSSQHYVDLPAQSSLLVERRVQFDYKRGRDQNGTLDDTLSNTLGGEMPAVEPGRYHAIVRVDMLNNLSETVESNNCGASDSTVNVDVPQLYFDISDTTIVQNMSYYRIDVPDSLVGRTMRIEMDVDETYRPIAGLELLIGDNFMPTRQDYTHHTMTWFEPNQELMVESLSSGTYYLGMAAIRSSASQRIVVRATTPTFTIYSVDPSAAATGGRVTITIRGASMSAGDSVFLVNEQETIPMVGCRFINRAEIAATFNLTETPIGIYDIRFRHLECHITLTPDTAHPIILECDTTTITQGTFEVLPQSDNQGLRVTVDMPSSMRVGQVFGFVLNVTNTTMNDVWAPLLLVYGDPDLEMVFEEESDYLYGGRKVFMISETSPFGTLKPGESSTITGRAISPNSGGRIRIHAALLSVSSLPFDFDYELRNIGIDPFDPDWSEVIQEIRTEIGNDGWDGIERAIAEVVNTYQTDEVHVYDFESLLLQLLSLRIDRINAETTPANQLVESRILQASNSLDEDLPSCEQEPLCDVESCLYDRAWLQSFVNLYGSMFGMATAVTHLNHYIEGTGTPITWGKYSWASIVSKATGAFWTRSPSQIASLIAQEVAKPQLAEIIRANHGSCPPSAFYPLPADPLTSKYGLLANRPSQGGEADETRPWWKYITIPVGTALPIGSWDVLGAFKEFNRPTLAAIKNLKCKPYTSSKCRKGRSIKYSAQLQVFYRDYYDFDRNANPLSPIDNIPYCLSVCCGAKPFSTAIETVWDFKGEVIIENFEDCCSTYPRCPSDDGDDDDGDDGSDDDDGGACDSGECIESVDPNLLVGPGGNGPQQWIDRERTLPYTVYFENDPERATAPAQTVRIEVPLDSTVNFTSFRLGNFGFGSFNFEVPSGRAYYNQRLDLRDSLGLYVDMTASLDIAERQAFWVFRSIDPATGLPPVDPFAGFLPVNDSSGHGQGYVSYTVRPRADAHSGDIVHAQASITFDSNEPLDTPPVFNTIDAGIPSSCVDSLPSILDSTTFLVHWNGQDDSNGSGVANYDLYVSYNNGPFEMFDSEIEDTVMAFAGEVLNTYSFFTIARDSVGYLESAKDAAEGSITLALNVPAKPIQDLTILVRPSVNALNIELNWSPIREDTIGRSVTISEYRIYSRSGAQDRHGVWTLIGSTQDTTFDWRLPNREPATSRFFQVLAICEDAPILLLDPRWRTLPVRELRKMRAASPIKEISVPSPEDKIQTTPTNTLRRKQ